jgi:hypothetical protein
MRPDLIAQPPARLHRVGVGGVGHADLLVGGGAVGFQDLKRGVVVGELEHMGQFRGLRAASSMARCSVPPCSATSARKVELFARDQRHQQVPPFGT